MKPWQRVLVLFACGLALGAVVWWPMILSPGAPTGDGRAFLFMVDAAKAAFRTYGEVPLWNPFDCAGIPAWDHPESITASPVTLLLQPLSATATLVAWQLWHIAFGFLGMWLLCRDDLKLSRTATLFAAVVFATGPWFAGQTAGLHATMTSFEYVPLLFFLWRRAETSTEAAIGAGGLVALMIFDGATYPLPFSVLALAVETLTRMVDRKRIRPIVTRGLLAVVTAIGLSSVRLLPLLSRLGQGDRGIGDEDTVARLDTLWTMFTWRESNTVPLVPLQNFQWHEYIAYLGIAGLALALVGMVFALREREYRWTALVGAVVFVLMLGHFSRLAPWPLLREHVPPFNALRVGSRFRHVFVVFTCLWTALAIDRLPVVVKQIFKSARASGVAGIVIVALALFAAEDELVFASRVVGHHYEGEPPHPGVASPRFYYGGEGLAPDWLDQPSQNRAHTGCRASFAFREKAAIWTEDVPQARAASETVVVESSSRTHNTFDFVAVSAGPGRVLLNSAYDRGWTSDAGEVANQSELLAVDVPAGRHAVHVRYRPRHIVVGLVLTLLTTLAVGLYFARKPLSSRLPRLRRSPT